MMKMNSAKWIRTACSRAVVAVAVAAALAACTYRETDNPVVRKFSWFSYLNGDDVRAACRVGGPEHWRFAYNGIYIEQIRTYDLTEQPDGTFRLRVNVAETPNLAKLSVKRPKDLLTPWQGPVGTVILGRDQRDLLARAAEDDGVFAPAPKGLQLHSDDFYWTGVVCRNGEVSFNAYRWPSERFKGLSLPGVLFAWDPTGIPVNPPRQTSTRELYGEENPDGAVQFNLAVGDNGLAGVKPLF
jgi:hypothetical protein